MRCYTENMATRKAQFAMNYPYTAVAGLTNIHTTTLL